MEILEFKEKTVYIVGTGHVFRKSVNEVRAAIKEIKPDVVAVELDLPRFLNRNKRPKPNFKSKEAALQALLFHFQKKAGQQMKSKPGREMIVAVEEARKHNIPAVFIDQDIRVTLKKLTKIPFSEKLNLAKALLMGLLGLGGKEDLNAIFEQREELMKELKHEFPTIYKVLVAERDAYMAQFIARLPQKRILVVIGAGHSTGLKNNLHKLIPVKKKIGDYTVEYRK